MQLLASLQQKKSNFGAVVVCDRSAAVMHARALQAELSIALAQAVLTDDSEEITAFAINNNRAAVVILLTANVLINQEAMAAAALAVQARDVTGTSVNSAQSCSFIA